MIYRNVNTSRAEREANRMAGQINHTIREHERKIDLIGPAPCFFSRIRGHYRWQILLRGDQPGRVVPTDLERGWGIDVDPVSLL
jgi:primosomal protein N' (replication factor Y)